MGRKKWRQYQDILLKSIRQDSMETKDWEPAGKCNHCLDKGDDIDASSVPRPPSESASISSGCSGERDTNTPQGMTTLESVASSVAAGLAAVAAITSVKPSGPPIYPPHHLFPQWYLTQPPLPETVPKSKSPMVMALPPTGPDQPLDLSKSSAVSSGEKSPEPAESTSPLHHLISSPLTCPQSLKVPSLNRQIFKAKPRISAVAGRRTYTEDELQAALRDIQSGKLGTRRAAVIYGIPRSTLRNKVYKLAMERERDSHLVVSGGQDMSRDDNVEEDDEERDLSGAEEEREVEKALMKPLISVEDLIRMTGEGSNLAGAESLRALLQHGSKFFSEQKKDDGSSSPPIYSPNYPPNPDLWNNIDQSALAPYINQLFVGNMNSINNQNPFVNLPRNSSSPNERSPTGSPGDFHSKFPPIELVRRMIYKERMIQEDSQKKDQRIFHMNGSRPTDPGPSSSVVNQEASHDETSGSATPPNVILRIPSFKPTSKNGVPGDSTGYPVAIKTGESSQHSVMSPPISGTRSESSSPPGMIGKGINVSLRDVIAKSISQKFQQPSDMHNLGHAPASLDHFRRTDFSSPLSCNPTLRNHNNNNLDDRKIQSSVKPSPSGSSSSSSGGKGTRPKRGKYRNYDRDSLVEAVKAVQRGEMSVHRAGSYYGVPHSTLEYKVKERHLMRPRKREPKTAQEDIKRPEETNVIRLPPGDKCKPLPPKPPKAPFTPPSPLPGANGLKIPAMFDPALSYSGGPPFPFWPPAPFPHLPMEYPRGPNFNPTPEQFFASQMIHRLQDDSARSSQSPPPTLGKTARELAEKLYDGTGANGSFLDGIIRSSLESGSPLKNKEGGNNSPECMSNKTLLDQLCINSRITPLLKSVSTRETDSPADETSKKAQHQNRSMANLSPAPHEPAEEVKTETEEEKIELNVETSDVSSIGETRVNPEDIVESACDSKYTISRVEEAKVEEKEIRS